MWVARVDEGFVFGGLTAHAVETLTGVPMLLESTDPRVRERLLPDTFDEESEQEHWQKHAVPELERLFSTRAQVVRRDLAAMQKLPKSATQVLFVPDKHANAWLAALNAARLALFVLNDLTGKHLEPEGFGTGTPKQQEAILRIHLLAEIQSVLLGDFELDDGGPLADLRLE